ncbi:hypothetical protein NX059_011821 [Plenodomus lindquistii]|nr:hypothetical protein NX059_011821 [Plenodomus lindquistii]
MLKQTPMTVEYGADAKTGSIIIHEEMLRCHSKLFSDRCEQAKTLRGQYAECHELLRKLGSNLFFEATPKEFETERLDLKVIPLLLEISTKYPLKTYQRSITETIDGAIDNEISNKNFKPLPGSGNQKRKDARDMTRAVSLTTRLGYLKPQGVRGVAEQLYAKLHNTDKTEKSKAQNNPLVAVAQKRILLPDADDTTVQLLVHWIYHGALNGQDADQTYGLMCLAGELGVEALREKCLSALAKGVEDTLQGADEHGISLAHLLGCGVASTNQLLDTVFKRVFSEKRPPERLRDLVIHAIADDLDMELWEYIKGTLSHDLALQLIESIVIRKQIKFEQTEMHMKSEEVDPATGQLLQIGNDAPRASSVARRDV